MAGFATRPSFAGHTGGSATTNHELTSTADHLMRAGQFGFPFFGARPRIALSVPDRPFSACYRKCSQIIGSHGDDGAAFMSVFLNAIDVKLVARSGLDNGAMPFEYSDGLIGQSRGLEMLKRLVADKDMDRFNGVHAFDSHPEANRLSHVVRLIFPACSG
jgi:hypothetical protein